MMPPRSRYLLVALILTGTLAWWGLSRQQSPNTAPVTQTAGPRQASPVVSLAKPEALPVITAADPSPPAGTVTVSEARPDAPQDVKAFRDWARDYFKAAPSERQAMLPEGRQLAAAHRQTLGRMIPEDPRQALQDAVPMVVRQDLPAVIVSELEQRVNAVGELNVFCSSVGAAPAPEAGRLRPDAATAYARTFAAKGSAAGEFMSAYTYGTRLRDRSLPETRVNGIAVDGQLAYAPQRLQPLEVGERLPSGLKVQSLAQDVKHPEQLVPATVQAPPVVPAGMVAVRDHEQVSIFDDASVADMYMKQLADMEASTPDDPFVLAEGGAGGGLKPFNVPAGSTTGTKSLLYMRVAFPDIMQEPRSEAEVYDVMRRLTDFFMDSSFGRFYFTTTVAPLVVLPYPEQWYIASRNSQGQPNGYTLLQSHAREAAARLGYDTNGYDRDVVDYKGGPHTTNGVSWAGLASVGGKGLWLYNQSAGGILGVLAHESGHNLGLPHSNLWQPATSPPTAIGPGQNNEYGNIFDVMGGGTGLTPPGHFDAWGKNLISWLTDDQLYNVQTSGTYRIYQVDQSRADADKRYALHVPKDSERDYWVEFRQTHTGNPTLMSGVMLTWSAWGNDSQTGATNGSNGCSQLVDTTPGSVPLFNLRGNAADTRDDAAITVGRTFEDKDGGVYITPVLKSTTTPPYMDVVINRGTFAGNHAPTLSVRASATSLAGTGIPVTLTATASDPDGDTLAYFWDFGDGSTSVNNAASQSHSWATAGSYNVSCTTSDMKGKHTVRAVLVSVGTPAAVVYRVSGTVRDSLGNPIEGVMVTDRAPAIGPNQPNASSFHYAFTDSNGFYILTNLPASNTTIFASQYPYSFSPVSTSTFNPLDANRTGIDFTSADPSDVITITVNDGVMTEGAADTATITLTRPASSSGNLDIQFLDGSSGTAFLGTDYTIIANPTSGAITQVQSGGNPVGTSRIRFNGAQTGPPAVPQVNTVTLTITAINDAQTEGVEYAVLEFPDTTSAYPIIGPRTVVIPINDAQSTRPVVKLLAVESTAIEGGKNVVLQLERNGPTTSALTVNLNYSGAAANGTDITGPTSVVIPAGADRMQVTIPAIDDVLAEGTEAFTVTLATSATYSRDTQERTVTCYVADNDQPVVNITAPDASASESGTNPGKFTITRTAADVGSALTVLFSLGGSALNGQDFRRIDGIAVIPAYETSVDINIEPFNDSIDEPDQTVICRLSTDDAYAIGSNSSATVTITDDDSSQFTIQSNGTGNGAVQEPSTGQSTLNLFTISRPSAGTAATVNFTVSGTASEGSDYSTLPRSLTFAATDVSLPIPVTLLSDSVKESSESIIITLQSGSGYRLGFETSSTLWIQDESSTPTVSVSLDDQTGQYLGVSEPTNTVSSITLGNGGSGYSTVPTVTITSAVGGTGSGATATATMSGTAPNRTVSGFNITNGGSGYTIADLPLTVTITGGGGTGATATANIGSTARFYVSRVGGNQTQALTVNFALGGSATSNAAPLNTDWDYIPEAASSISIPANQSGTFFDIQLLPDVKQEGTEDIIFTVANNAAYSVGSGTSTLFINDIDAYSGSPAPSVGFATSSSAVPERTGTGTSTLTIPVSLSPGSSQQYPVVVDYVISGGTATGRGVDYNFTSGTLTFTNGGPVTQNLTLTTVADSIPEGDETVTLRLQHPHNANLGQTTHVITITDHAMPEVFTDGVVRLPTITAELRGHVYPDTKGVVGSVVMSAGGTGYATPPAVSFSGGGGNGAAATATVNAGVVTAINVTSAGTGYTSSPTVTITGGGGTGASAVSVVIPAVALDGVGSVKMVTGGTGYTDGPVVNITGGGGNGATATAIVSGGLVTGIVVNTPGSDYTSVPTVTITGGGGTGATASATMDGGVIMAINVTAGGSGYSALPVVVFSGGGGSGATAVATVAGGAITGVTVLTPGSGYTAAPLVSFTGGGGSGAAAVSARSATRVWFEWGTSVSLGKVTEKRNAGSGFGGSSVAFTSYVDQLPVQLAYPATYYYRAVAENGFGSTRGIIRTLHTAGDPVVTTLPEAGHTASTVIFDGSVNPARTNGNAWFEYGPTVAYGSSSPRQTILSAATAKDFRETITGLPEGTLLHYRAVFQNTLGTFFGVDKVVAAVPQKVAGDLLVNLNAIQPSAGSASWTNLGALAGTFARNGAPSLEYAEPGNLPAVLFDGVSSSYTGPVPSADISGNDSRSLELWFMNPGFGPMDSIASLGRAGVLTQLVATHGNAGIAGGALQTGTGAADNLTYAAASLPSLGAWHHLVITYDGAKKVSLYVDGAVKLTKTLSANLATSTDPITLGAALDAAGLPVNFFHGYLNSLRIHGGVLSASDVLFNYNVGPVGVLPDVPAVSVAAPSAITSTSATLNAEVSPTHQATTAWFEWGTSPTFTNATAPVSLPAGRSWVPMSAPLSGLAPGVEYYFRVVAQNASGVTEGLTGSFTARSNIRVAGGLYADLRATDLGLSVPDGINHGGLGEFDTTGVTRTANAGGTGIPGIVFTGAESLSSTLGLSMPRDVAFSSDHTLETWVMTTAPANAYDVVAQLGGKAAPFSAEMLAYGTAGGVLDGSDAVDWTELTPPGYPLLGAWHHVVVVNTGTSRILYVDGVKRHETALPAGANILDTEFSVGFNQDIGYGLFSGTGTYFTGFINSLRLHGGALSAADVLANYQAGPEQVSSPVGVAPTATTLSGTARGKATASFSGRVNPGGLPTTALFEWSGPANGSMVVPLSTTFATEDVSALVGGLPTGLYSFRVSATNAQGTVHGSYTNFTFADAPSPGAQTLAATALAPKKATFNGIAAASLLTAQAWFEYGIPPQLGNVTPKVSLKSSAANRPVTASVTTLLPHTNYQYRLVVEDSSGIAVGELQPFATTNTTPVASAGSITINEDTPTTLSLKGTDADGEALTISVVTPPLHGILTGTSLTPLYTPAANFAGTDSFQFTVTDGAATSGMALFSITIKPVNDAPVPQAGMLTVAEDSAANAGTLTAIDPEGDAISSFALVTPPTKGVATVLPNGGYTYTPKANAYGADSFTFTASNAAGSGAPAVVIISITPAQDAPVATGGDFFIAKDTVLNEVAPAVDVDGDTLSFTQLSSASHGVANLSSNGTFSYTPTSGYVGTDNFTFKVNDGTVDSGVGTVTITIGMTTATDGHFTGFRDDLLTDVLSYTDPDGSPLSALTFSAVSNPGHGTVVVTANGNFRYNPQSNFVGTDSFTFRIQKAGIYSNPATVYITVIDRPPNWAWVEGPSVAKKAGVYGVLNTAAATNNPGSRSDAAAWNLPDGTMYLLGGNGYGSGTTAGLLSDLWRRGPDGGWVWVGGPQTTNTPGNYGAQGLTSAGSWPGARSGALTWVDGDGKLWLFGGTGRDSTTTGNGLLSDLWCYDTLTQQWTWVRGSNFININGTYGTLGTAGTTAGPGARAGAVGWQDASGRLWLFGGTGRAASGTTASNLNDLWCYSISDNVWTWMGGAKTLDANGSYGAKGVPSPVNTPGGRSYASAWTGTDGRFYLFGGSGRGATGTTKGNLNDLWVYEPFSCAWTWLTGASTVNGAASYGQLGLPAATNTPGARSGAATIQDGTSNTILFGGQGSGAMNDLWRYDSNTKLWVWLKGQQTANGAGVYGQIGVGAPNNTPGARRGSAVIQDGTSNTILFGGANGTSSYADTWKLDLAAVPVVHADQDVTFFSPGRPQLSFTINPNGLQTGYSISLINAATQQLEWTDNDSVSDTLPTPHALSVTVTPVPDGVYEFQVVATNAAGTAFSNRVRFDVGAGSQTIAFDMAATLTVSEAGGSVALPVMLSLPADDTITVPVLLSGTATVGTDYTAPPAQLQFFKGQTRAWITIPVISDAVDEADESLIVTLDTSGLLIGVGAVDSVTITITDDEDLPVITTPPVSQFAKVGDTVTFSVAATGPGLKYQWKKNGAKISGATASTLTLTNVALSAATNYLCEVSNAQTGTTPVVSGAAELFVVDGTPKKVLLPSGDTSFTVSAAGPAGTNLTYSWRNRVTNPLFDAVGHLSGTATNKLIFTGLLPTDSEVYTCRVSKTGTPALFHDSGDFTLAVPDAVPVVTTTTLPAAVAGVPYSYQVTVDPDLRKAPVSYIFTGLPAGVTGNTTTGLISGKPTLAGAYSITVSAKNAVNTGTQVPLTLTVATMPSTLSGSFAGLMDRGPGQGIFGGRFDVTVSTVGVATAKVMIPGYSGSFTGPVTPVFSGVTLTGQTLVATYKPSGLPTITLTLAFDVAGGAVTGTFMNPTTLPAPVNASGVHNPWTTPVPVSNPGDYTALLDIPAVNVGDYELPQGSGYATFKLSPDGKLTFAGKTTDGLAFTSATLAGPGREVPVFALFTTALGSLHGQPVINASGYLSGQLSWNKSAAPATSKDMAYRTGFAPLNLTVTGGFYPGVSAGNVIMDLSNTDANAKLSFSEGGLAPGDVPDYTLNIRNLGAGGTQTITYPLPNANKLSLKLATSPAGSISGSLTVPNALSSLVRTTTYQGVIAKINASTYRAAGFYLMPQLPQPGQTTKTSPVLSGGVLLKAP